MKNNCLTFFAALLVCFYLLTSCRSRSNINENQKQIEIQEEREIDESPNFENLVQEWNDAHISKDTNVFSALFNYTVLYYGTQLEKKSCIENKLSFFTRNPDYHQQIQGKIQVEKISDFKVKCSFVKRVNIKQVATDYPSYLLFKKIEDQWKIITEGDLVTDKNIAKAKSLHSKIPKNAVKGDFNGDGVEEYMWVIKPKINEDNMDCIGDCVSYIQFSDPIIPSIEIENCIGGVPANEGDLNKNGGDEIGILPEWFSSCWKMYHVWTFRKGKWINAVEPFSVYCDLFEQKRKLIEIDQKKEGNVIIWYSGHTQNHTEIITKSRSVPIAR